ncbi:MAG TPA: flavodoxin domain-containing protein [Kofleriaceae bacterium]|nr:flavodoxin domain-containing protein [Kofleriaceae bacterium]
MKRILVTFGSKRGGTAEIAARIAGTLRARGHEVDCERASLARDVERYDAIVVGGALYALRWAREASRFVARQADTLRARAVWMFSSGPLDDGASERAIPPTRQVARLMARVGAIGHATFGGRLAPDAKGFIAASMAKKRSGDWRDWAQVDAWAVRIDRELAVARAPRTIVHAPRWPLAALCLFVGVTAIGGGAMLIAAPDGSLLRAPLSVLAHSPFTSFLIPGLLLLVVIGFGNAIAAASVAGDTPHADHLAFAGGTALLVWTVVEMALLRSLEPIQLGYVAIAIAILAMALRRHEIHARN